MGRHLFLTVGDRHHQDRAQELAHHAGTIVRLHDDGRVPDDNPFVGRSDARPEIWSWGQPVISFGWEYSGGPIGKGIVAQEGMQQPAWVWTPAIAPSGMLFYTGDAFPRWRGNLFIGAMGRRHLNRLVLREGSVVLEERLMHRQAGRVRLVSQGPDGLIYIGSDDGRILRLRPSR